jgi:hypothetical protein
MTLEECRESIGREVMYLGYPSPEQGTLIGTDGAFAAVQWRGRKVASRCVPEPLILLQQPLVKKEGI